MCLSLHQPWAQMVVLGLMRYESRMWDSTYRGPLWIHAGGHVPTEETISLVEETFRNHYGPTYKMPDRYPLGSVIGIVDL
jgi:activating signal cointegrator 1